MRRDRGARARPGEAGLSMVEVLVGTALALVIALIAYAFIDYVRKSYAAQTDLANAQSAGRSILDVLGGDVRMAGYSPLGAAFAALPAGDATRLRVLSDRDGDGVVGTASEEDENLTYVFSDADGDGVYSLARGVDLNGDGDFADAGESLHVVCETVVPIDFDRDGADDPFLAYDQAPPATTRVTVAFGVRTAHRDVQRRAFPVVPFESTLALRNRQEDLL